MPGIDPALTIECPQCKQPRGEYCISRHGIRVHRARRDALAGLSRKADRILRRHGRGGSKEC